ncbi:MAG: DUF2214 family protein [Saprospiraceae bacterium]|jgi:putative membrane protein
MTWEILFRYLHLLSILLVGAAIFAENILISRQLSGREVRRLAKLDGLYGLGAILILTFGLVLWFGVGKDSEYYSNNWIFHLKLGLFILLGAFSIYPTVFFLKHRKCSDDVSVVVPNLVLRMVRIELGLLALIPLLATLMAKGIGYFG